jgi:hypothetical protein
MLDAPQYIPFGDQPTAQPTAPVTQGYRCNLVLPLALCCCSSKHMPRRRDETRRPNLPNLNMPLTTPTLPVTVPTLRLHAINMSSRLYMHALHASSVSHVQWSSRRRRLGHWANCIDYSNYRWHHIERYVCRFWIPVSQVACH